MPFTTRKIHRNMVAIERDGAVVCYLRPNEVRGWIFRAERAEIEDAHYAALAAEQRRERITEYLAERSARRAQAARQLSFAL